VLGVALGLDPSDLIGPVQSGPNDGDGALIYERLELSQKLSVDGKVGIRNDGDFEKTCAALTLVRTDPLKSTKIQPMIKYVIHVPHPKSHFLFLLMDILCVVFFRWILVV